MTKNMKKVKKNMHINIQRISQLFLIIFIIFGDRSNNNNLLKIIENIFCLLDKDLKIIQIKQDQLIHIKINIIIHGNFSSH